MQDADSQPAADDAPPLPTDLGACHTLLLEQARAITNSVAARDDLQLQVRELEAYVKRLLNQLYGRRSERSKHDPKQPLLDFGDDPAAQDALAEAAAEAEKIIEEHIVRRTVKKKNAPPRTEKFPEHLKRVEEVIDPPAAERECAEHGPKECIGYDTTESLEFTRPQLWVKVTKHRKYACRKQPECGVTQAERTEGLVEGNRFGTSVAAEIIANKYAYHLPLYREQDLFASSGWTPSRSTLLNILVAATFVVRPLAEYLLKLALDGGGIGCDETYLTLIVPPVAPPIDPQDPRSKRCHEVLQGAIDKGEPSVKARMWAYRSFELPINVFDFTVSRHRDGPAEILEDFTGTLLTDCYSGFDAIAFGSNDRILRAACWAHARRKFAEIATNYPRQSAVMLALIRELYDVEDRARKLSADDRRALRESAARPVLERIRVYLDCSAIRDALPKSDLAKAAAYVRNHWVELNHYVTDGRCPIDNNEPEQLMKQIAIGRKNWLFVGSVEGGARAAILMTVVSSAIRNDLDVTAYLKDVLDQLLAGSTNYESLCPHVWKLAHPESVRTYRADERRDAVDRQTFRRAQRRVNRAK